METLKPHPWFIDDDEHEYACPVFYFADAECSCHDEPVHADGPPFDAATATGIYDLYDA